MSWLSSSVASPSPGNLTSCSSIQRAKDAMSVVPFAKVLRTMNAKSKSKMASRRPA